MATIESDVATFNFACNQRHADMGLGFITPTFYVCSTRNDTTNHRGYPSVEGGTGYSANIETDMENIDELQRQASDAISSRLWTNTVAIVNSIRRVGRHPVTNRPANGEDAGTGCVGRWGSHHFILTAGHVPHSDAQPADLRIFWRPTGGIERVADADLKPRDIGHAVAIRDPKAVIHRCLWEDLAVIELDPAEAGPHTEFFDIATGWIDPAEGEIVHCCGFPIDKHIPLGSRMVGTKTEYEIALRPTIFSGAVFHQPTFLAKAFDVERHYLVPYERNVSRHPEGFSGAAAWWENDQPQKIWQANLVFAGICTSCYKDGAIEQIVKASAVRQFLKEAFGAP